MTQWQAKLRNQGYRLTPQRELILKAVEKLGHATPDEVYAEARTHAESINLSTVYRTLELLNDLGLIRHAHLSDRSPTYHAVTDREHCHLICRTCRTVISVDSEDMAGALQPLLERESFLPDYGHLTVFGTCAECDATL